MCEQPDCNKMTDLLNMKYAQKYIQQLLFFTGDNKEINHLMTSSDLR